ncbi:hypothetical protein LINPERPRIM_LOCUS25699 [Linum perenne]
MSIWSYPPTRRQAAAMVLMFAAGASLFGYGAYMSMKNVEPQQERTRARNEFVKERIRKLIGED